MIIKDKRCLKSMQEVTSLITNLPWIHEFDRSSHRKHAKIVKFNHKYRLFSVSPIPSFEALHESTYKMIM